MFNSGQFQSEKDLVVIYFQVFKIFSEQVQIKKFRCQVFKTINCISLQIDQYLVYSFRTAPLNLSLKILQLPHFTTLGFWVLGTVHVKVQFVKIRQICFISTRTLKLFHAGMFSEIVRPATSSEKALVQVFSYEFCEILKDTFLIEHLPWLILVFKISGCPATTPSKNEKK